MGQYIVIMGNGKSEQKRKFQLTADGPKGAAREAISRMGCVAQAFELKAGNTANHNVEVWTPDNRKVFFDAHINLKEPDNCSNGVLHQNWFSNMEMVYEYFERQVFFDKASRCFYDVSEDSNGYGGILIKEISPSHPLYNTYVNIASGR